jgi:hypothetical protein
MTRLSGKHRSFITGFREKHVDKRTQFVRAFRAEYGRNPTGPDIQRILKDHFGTEATTNPKTGATFAVRDLELAFAVFLDGKKN